MKKVSTYKTHTIYRACPASFSGNDSLAYPTFHIESKKVGFWANFIASISGAKKLINKVYPRI